MLQAGPPDPLPTGKNWAGGYSGFRYNGGVMGRPLTVLFLLWLVMGSAGCDLDQHDHPDLKTGRELFDYHCAPCHKADGSGVFLKGVPANRHTDLSVLQVMHKVQSASGGKKAMPVFARMPQQEQVKIAIYLKYLGVK